MMIRRLILLLFILVAPSLAQATTYYIDDAGSNSNNGLTTGAPWLTWAYAFTNSACGDTLIVMDGTYTTATHGNPNLTRVCTAGNAFTIQAQNQRAAKIQGSGVGASFKISSSAYIVVDGLYITGADTVTGSNDSTVRIHLSDHVTLKNNIVQFNNRYYNTHLTQVSNSTDVLMEGNEGYSFHRHGFFTNNSLRVIYRRNYCNPRNYADIGGGYVSSPSTSGDDCFIAYPGSNHVFENNIAEGAQLKGYALEPLTDYAQQNKFYGDISIGNTLGMSFDARGTATHQTPRDNLVKDLVVIGATSEGIRINGTIGNRVDNSSIIGTTGSYGLDVNKGQVESFTPRTFYSDNVLLLSNTGTGFRLVTADIATWTVTNSNANSNGTNYNPASHANYDPTDTPSSAAPGMASCYLWAPDGSAADTNGWGAEILYRYQDGVLTSTPLWDPTTGVFPHGATVTGVNDINGSSPYNVHERLHVGVANGCAFPASFVPVATPPQNPANYTTGEGTTSTTFNINVPVGTKILGVCVALWEDAAGVGSVSGITSGGEALALAKAQKTSPGYRQSELWYKLTPTTGASRSLVVSTTGTVDGIVTTAFTLTNVSALNTAVSATNTSSTPGVTASTQADETLVDCMASGKTYALTAGNNQTLQRLDSHTTQALRLATSSQSGANGGSMDYVNGGSTTWSTVALSLLPDAPGAPANPVLTQSKYRLHAGFGPSEASPILLGAQDAAVSVAPTGMFRARMEITESGDTITPVGFKCFCNRNGGAYAEVMDSFGSNVFRFYGSGTDPYLPSSNTSTTRLIGANDGNFITGALIRSSPAVYTVPTMSAGKHVEMEYAIVLNATAGDVIKCRTYFDNGTAINAYTVDPTINVIAPSASGGF